MHGSCLQGRTCDRARLSKCTVCPPERFGRADAGFKIRAVGWKMVTRRLIRVGLLIRDASRPHRDDPSTHGDSARRETIETTRKMLPTALLLAILGLPRAYAVEPNGMPLYETPRPLPEIAFTGGDGARPATRGTEMAVSQRLTMSWSVGWTSEDAGYPAQFVGD